MKGSFFLGAQENPRFEVRDMVFPEELGAHEVLVKVMACGVCGTDVHIYHGEEGSAAVTPPVVLGHEFSGVVVKQGSEVNVCAEGDCVCIDPNMYCGKCRPCRMGRKQNCEHLYALGVNTNGGFAEYCICPDTNVLRMAPGTGFNEAAMAEPIACAIHGIELANIELGQNVLVIGGGTIGLLMIQLAKLRGAAKVLLSEPNAFRRQIGLEVGAAAAIDPIHEDLRGRIREETGCDGADIVIECVGRPIAAKQAIEAAGLGARILLFSVPAPGTSVELPLMDVFKKELTLVGSLINPDTHQKAVELISSHRLQIERLVTHVFPLNQVEDAIKMQMSDASIKVMVHPNN